jgi:gluconolactonase
MFAPPPVVETELFARLPDSLRRKGRCAWGDANNGRRDTECFLEGPAFDRAGNLYVTDIPYGRVFRVDPSGRFDVVAEYDGQPNGLKIHRDGRIFISDYRRGILTLDPASGTVSDFLVGRHSESFKGVNDLYFADNGDLYFTDQGQTGLQDATGRVYRWTLSPAPQGGGRTFQGEGRLELLLDKVPSPNGITLNGAQNMLLLAVTRGNAIWRAPIMADGSLSKVGIFIQMSGGIGPDGIAMDEADSVAVAHAGMGGAWLFSRQGVPLAFVKSCAGEFTTNLAYGGPDRRDLYIVESGTGSILRARMDVPGRKHHSHTE